MVEDLYKKYSDRIDWAQMLLRNLDPTNTLIDLVDIDGESIKWNAEFGALYERKSVDEALGDYANKLEEQVRLNNGKEKSREADDRPLEDFNNLID